MFYKVPNVFWHRWPILCNKLLVIGVIFGHCWPLAGIIIIVTSISDICIAARRDYYDYNWRYNAALAARLARCRAAHRRQVWTTRDMSALCVTFWKTSAGIFCQQTQICKTYNIYNNLQTFTKDRINFELWKLYK